MWVGKKHFQAKSPMSLIFQVSKPLYLLSISALVALFFGPIQAVKEELPSNFIQLLLFPIHLKGTRRHP